MAKLNMERTRKVMSLTPEQQKEYDSIQSAGERKLFLKMLELEDDTKNADNATEQVTAPSNEDSEKTSGKTPDLGEAKQAETIDSTPEKEETKEDTNSLEYLMKLAEKNKKEAEIAEKRRADAESYLTPIMQENASLVKKLEELSLKIASLEASKATKTEDEQSEDFALYDPDIEKRIKLSEKALENRIKKEVEEKIRALDDKTKEFESVIKQKSKQDFWNNYYMEVKKHHNDIDDYILNGKNGPALVEWAKLQESPVILDVVMNNDKYSAKDVVFVLNQFKKSVKIDVKPEEKKPSLADVAIKAVASNQKKEKTQDEPSLFPSTWTEKDFNNHIHKLNNKHKFDKNFDKILDDAIEKWSLTVINKNK